jgi:hypothetical protein
MGWKIHRIWSTSWFHSPDREMQVLVAAIQAAMAGDAPHSTGQNEPEVVEDNTEYPPSTYPVSNELPSTPEKQSSPYQFATVTVNLGTNGLHSVPATQLSAWLAEVANSEGPIHWLEAARRVASAGGIQRVGNRIQDAFWQACRSGSRKKLFALKGEFIWKTDTGPVLVRDRSNLPPQSKKLDYVAPEEIDAAIKMSVIESFGMKVDEVATSACRLLGFARVTEDMRAIVERRRDQLSSDGKLSMRGDCLVWSDE